MFPILFKFGQVTIYSYGFFVALAMAAVLLSLRSRARKLGLESHTAADLVFVLFVAGVLGARLFFVLQHFSSYRDFFWRIFWIQEGGLIWYGGFITAALAGILYARARKEPVLKWCDFFAPLLALGHAIGRIGCFLNGCCYGRTTDPAFGVVFPGDRDPRIPIQLLEAGFLFLLALWLFSLQPSRDRDGRIFTFYLLWYSVLRFFLEFLRGDQVPVYYLTPPQWTSLVLFAGALCLLNFFRKKPKHDAQT